MLQRTTWGLLALVTAAAWIVVAAQVELTAVPARTGPGGAAPSPTVTAPAPDRGSTVPPSSSRPMGLCRGEGVPGVDCLPLPTPSPTSLPTP